MVGTAQRRAGFTQRTIKIFIGREGCSCKGAGYTAPTKDHFNCSSPFFFKLVEIPP